jgi:hypothetical protein
MKIIATKNSSFIEAITHTRKTLFVKMKTGAIYGYKNVPTDLAARFAKAKSKGRFYSKNIKGSFDSFQVV